MDVQVKKYENTIICIDKTDKLDQKGSEDLKINQKKSVTNQDQRASDSSPKR